MSPLSTFLFPCQYVNLKRHVLHHYIKSKPMFSSHRTLYTDGQASIPKLAEKLTLELVHHIEVVLPRITLTQCHFCFTRASTLTAVRLFLLLLPRDPYLGWRSKWRKNWSRRALSWRSTATGRQLTRPRDLSSSWM